MRYFIIKENPKFQAAPRIKNWFGKIDVRNIKQGSYHKLPERLLLLIEESEKTVFTDVIVTPFFLVNEEIKECLKLYEPNLGFKEMVLLDQKNKKAREYFMPTLEEVFCLTENCRYNRDGSVLLHGEFELSKIGNNSIFYLAEPRSNYIVVRLDVAESIIRRGSRGFILEEVACR